MAVLIVSLPADSHARAAGWGLAELGVAVRFLYFSDVPQRLALTIRPGEIPPIRFCDREGCESFEGITTMWFRRFGRVELGPEVHPADRDYALRDWSTLQRYVLQAQRHSSLMCVNGPGSFETRNLKPYQLQVAHLCGLRIPATLISNSAAEIDAFVEANARRGRETIVKGLDPMVWTDAGGTVRSLPTTVMKREDLSAANVSAAPFIYQERIPKAYEVRATVMGRTILSAKVDAQRFPEAQVDFRDVRDWTTLGCEQIELPRDVERGLLDFMARSELSFGTIDLVVDAEERWYFLENNESGNFLWVEKANPGLPILDAFTRFLASGDPDFAYRPDPNLRLSFADFERFVADNGDMLQKEQERHVPPSPISYPTEG